MASSAITTTESSPSSSPVPLETNSPPTEALEKNSNSDTETIQPLKKKKKRKPKKKSPAAVDTAAAPKPQPTPPVLCISRNKHWRYISSYHGPWLQLPLELLDSLLVLNLDPATLSPPIGNSSMNMNMSSNNGIGPKQRTSTNYNYYPSPPPFPTPLPGKPTPPPIDPGVFRCVTAIRRLIDEAAELAVRAASGGDAMAMNSNFMGMGGMSMMNGNNNMNMNMGSNMGPGGNAHQGRSSTLSPTRIHRLRVLAVQKLAAAYRKDEIASSVMVMQGGSVFDDLAERVLRFDPNDPDARYVHFFHEKIPSRQLAQSTTTAPLDTLISQHPHVLEYYRTRGIVHCFRDEYREAVRDFGGALKEARLGRKRAAQEQHDDHKDVNTNKNNSSNHTGKNSKKKSKRGDSKSSSSTTPSSPVEEATESSGDNLNNENDEDIIPSHPSTLPSAPGPLEPQLLFLRGAAYLQWAIWEIERGVLGLEGIIPDPDSKKPAGSGKFPFVDGAEIRLSNLESGRYGGTEMGTDGPLGKRDSEKARAYRAFFGFDEKGSTKKSAGGKEALKDTIIGLLKKSIRDHEKFLSHFDTLEAVPGDDVQQHPHDFGGSMSSNGKGVEGALPAPNTGIPNGLPNPKGTLAERTEYAFLLSESIRPGNHHQMMMPSSPPFGSGPLTVPNGHSHPLDGGMHFPHPTLFTTYHPLLVESHFSILLAQLMLGDFTGLLPAFARTAEVVDALEGYPVFLPPRSMAQAEFVEVLERLAGGWASGKEGFFNSTPPPPEENVDRKGKSRVPNFSTPPPPSSSASSSSSSNRPPSGSSSSSSFQYHEKETLLPNPLLESLNCARILLAPVISRQKQRAEKVAAEKAERRRASKASTPTLNGGHGNNLLSVLGAGNGIKGMGIGVAGKPINIPLHGPRVEVVLAWLGAGCLVELEEAEVSMQSF